MRIFALSWMRIYRSDCVHFFPPLLVAGICQTFLPPAWLLSPFVVGERPLKSPFLSAYFLFRVSQVPLKPGGTFLFLLSILIFSNSNIFLRGIFFADSFCGSLRFFPPESLKRPERISCKSFSRTFCFC